ncbi:uncharacterized protein LOC141643448 isoform X2 [Silene latifolia]|uniref:uncharacterized protein LOC141643448 isoform X2 n=1 Tax=Silene latifolia TaxID=37657 RepID=UPI003D78B0E7
MQYNDYCLLYMCDFTMKFSLILYIALSHWCIFHRSKAEVVVATWSKQFHSSSMVQKVPLLYLANDILQNSKRKGNEFVTEFWKVLPAALKDVNSRDDEQGKKVISRLVKIWDERKVFGSKSHNVKDIMLADEPPPPLEFGKKRSRSVKIVRRDSRSIRTKLSIGGPEEKIVSAFHLILNERPTEESEMNRCKSAVNRVRKMDHDVEIACAQVKNPKRKILAKELETEENILKECIEKLKSVETNRVALVAQLREALQEQESELENIRTQVQVAQARADEANNMRKLLNDDNYVAPTPSAGKSNKTAADIAAEVADKLAASSSSQLIMSSVLSTFAAQELSKTGSGANSKSEQPTSVSDPNGQASAIPATSPAVPHQYQPMLVNPPSIQSASPSPGPGQGPGPSAQYQIPQHQNSQQYSVYGYGNLPPVPPPPVHMMGPMMPMGQGQMQMNQPQLMPMGMAQQPMTLMQQPPPIPPSFRPLQPPGMGYYTHSQ